MRITESSYTVEQAKDSPKINMWCSLLHDQIVGSFFFFSPKLSDKDLDMLEIFTHQIGGGGDLQSSIIFQPDRALPH